MIRSRVMFFVTCNGLVDGQDCAAKIGPDESPQVVAEQFRIWAWQLIGTKTFCPSCAELQAAKEAVSVS